MTIITHCPSCASMRSHVLVMHASMWPSTPYAKGILIMPAFCPGSEEPSLYSPASTWPWTPSHSSLLASRQTPQQAPCLPPYPTVTPLLSLNPRVRTEARLHKQQHWQMAWSLPHSRRSCLRGHSRKRRRVASASSGRLPCQQQLLQQLLGAWGRPVWHQPQET